MWGISKQSVFLMLTLLAQTSWSEGFSKKFSWLETPNEFQQKFIRDQSHRTDLFLNSSKNIHPINKALFTEYNESFSAPFIQLKDGSLLYYADKGLGEVGQVIKSDGKTEELLFSFSDLNKGKDVNIMGLALSPNERWLAMVIAVNGAITNFNMVVYDIADKKIKEEFQDIYFVPRLGWISDDTLMTYGAQASNPFNVIPLIYNAAANTLSGSSTDYLIDSFGPWVLYVQSSQLFLSNARDKTWNLNDYPGLYDAFSKTRVELLSSTATDLIFLFSVSQTNTQMVVRIPKNDLNQAKMILSETGLGLNQSFVSETRLGFFSKGTSVLIYDWDGKRLNEIPLPSCCGSGAGEFENDTVKISLTSFARPVQTYTYNLTRNAWDTKAMNAEMMTDINSNPYAMSNLMAVSSDGTQIPVMIFHRADIVINGNAPVLIESYGGFGVPNSPNFDSMKRDFMKRGGILAWPALRGGGELGPKWYAAAAGAQNKVKTYEDLIAVAKMFVTTGYTTADKIISTGGSNGGLTVAAAALLSPGSFGFVIPRAGVLDLTNFNKLDPQFWQGWARDYGNPGVPTDLEALAKIAPVELVKNQSATKFLVMTGSTDDRVNPVHSLKFTAALLAQGGSPDKVHLVYANHVGHGVDAIPMGELNSLRASATMWAMIYDHVGWQFAP